MTTFFVLLVLAAIVKLMLVTVFAGVRYQRRRDMENWGRRSFVEDSVLEK